MDIRHGQPEHGFPFDRILVVGLYDKFERPPGHPVILLVVVTFADQHIGVVNPPDIFFPVEYHGMFLDGFGCLGDPDIGILTDLACTGLFAIVEYRQHKGIIILDGILVLLHSLPELIHPVPVNIVMGGKVMIDPPGEGVFFRGAAPGDQHTGSTQEKESGKVDFLHAGRSIRCRGYN
jgi:hypothetical protein